MHNSHAKSKHHGGEDKVYDPLGYLYIIDYVRKKFLICSQTILEPWYALKLGIKCCEYED